MDYVLGFAFNDSGDEVLLIRKNRPSWQKGKLNGIGGKIEQDETPRMALVREFEEETGVTTAEDDWRPFGKMRGTDFTVHLFTIRNRFIYDADSMTDEKLKIVAVNRLKDYQIIPNLGYLIAMALDPDMLLCSISYN